MSWNLKELPYSSRWYFLTWNVDDTKQLDELRNKGNYTGVLTLVKDMVMEQFATLTQQKVPAFEMPDGYILYVGYNRETDTLDVGQMTNAGLAVQYSFPFDHNVTLEANLQEVNEKPDDMEEYQTEVQEENYVGSLHR